MRNRFCVRLTAWHAAILLSSLSLSGLAQADPITSTSFTQTTPSAAKLWNLKDVDIRTFIHTIAMESGKNFIVDPRVNAKITFISSRPLTSDELYQAFLSLLQINGFVALPDPAGKVVKIVPDYVAKGLSSPLFSHTTHKDGDAMAVAVVGVKYVPVNDLAVALNQFLTPAGHLAPYNPSNALIVADRAGNINRLMELVGQIDLQRSGRIDVIHLQNAQAKILVDTLKTMLTRSTSKDAPASTALDASIVADERTNSVLLGGGSPEQRAQIKSVIYKLDIPNSAPANVTEVIYLKHLHAERAATIVNGLIQNYLVKTKGDQAALAQTNTTSSSSSSSNSSSSPSNETSAVSSLFNAALNQSNSNNNMNNYSTGSNQNNDIASIVEKVPKSGSISPYVQWEESTNSLVVTAPRDIMHRVKQIIWRLDIRRPQVLIEAVIAEVSELRQKELGIQFNPGGSVRFQTLYLPELPLSIIGTNNQLATVAGGNGTVGQGLSFNYVTGGQVRALISALETDADSNVLATPNLVTLDNEPAQIKVGSKVPFATAQIQNNPTGGNPFNFYDREDVGLVLTIDPQITPNGSIKLLIQQELSAIIPGTAAGAGGNPTTSERFIRTTVMADNGKILVLGGLLQNQWNDSTNRIPFLGTLPGLGVLFRDHARTMNKTNLMIFLRPTILYNEHDTELVSGGKYEYLRQLQLQVDNGNPFRHHYVTPVLPAQPEAKLPPPFVDQIAVDPSQLRGQG